MYRMEKRFVLAVVVLFLAFSLPTLIRHEMWRDEIQTWGTVKGSDSISQLLSNKRYDGHPLLWYLGPFVLSRVTENPVSMQMYHLFLATLSVWIFLEHAPFTRLQRVLFVFGYFPFYEFAIISRDYAIGILLLFLIAAFWSKRRDRFALLYLLLFLLAQTNLFGLLFACVFSGALFLEFLWIRWRKGTGPTWSCLALGMAWILTGILVSALEMMPPDDSGFAVGWNTRLSPARAAISFSTVWKGFLPIPKPNLHFWNSNLLGTNKLQVLLSIPVYLLALVALMRRPKSLALFLAGSSLIFLFFYAKYLGYLRHHGHLYIFYITCLWMSCKEQEVFLPVAFLDRISEVVDRWRNPGLLILFSVHAVCGFYAVGMDLKHPFSASKRTGQWIAERYGAETILVGDMHYTASAVAGHMDRPFYYPRGQRTGTYLIFDWTYQIQLEPEEVLKDALRIMKREKRPLLLVLSYDLEGIHVPNGIHLELKEHFPPGIVPDETYYLYDLYEVR